MIDSLFARNLRYVARFGFYSATPPVLSYRGPVTARRTHVLYMLGAVGRLGLAALVVVVAVGATAVATGRTTVPLRALGAVRAAVGLSDATAPPPLPIARAAVLRVDPALDLPMAGVAADARKHTSTVMDEVAAQRAADEAMAAARAAERRAAVARAVPGRPNGVRRSRRRCPAGWRWNGSRRRPPPGRRTSARRPAGSRPRPGRRTRDVRRSEAAREKEDAEKAGEEKAAQEAADERAAEREAADKRAADQQAADERAAEQRAAEQQRRHVPNSKRQSKRWPPSRQLTGG